MAAFPTPFAGVVALYPLTQEKRFPVTVLQFTDFTEQRFRRSAGLVAFVLELGQITKAEKDAIAEFFEDAKGSFDGTWSITVGASTYNYMAFADDTLAATEQENGIWSMSIRVVQTRKN